MKKKKTENREKKDSLQESFVEPDTETSDSLQEETINPVDFTD